MRTALFAAVVAGTYAISPIAALAGSPYPASAYPPALYRAFGQDDDVDVCAREGNQSSVAYARRALAPSTVRLSRGTVVYIAEGRDTCVRGAHNSMLLAYVASGPGTYRRVLKDLVYEQTFRADGSAVTLANDGAAITLRTKYQFDGTSYRVTRAERVFVETGETKPMSVRLHFAPGSSGLTVSGRVYQAFGDTFTVAARAGQTLSVRVSPGHGQIALRVSSRDGSDLAAGRHGNSFRGRLSESGSYTIAVEGANRDSTASTYSMTVNIR